MTSNWKEYKIADLGEIKTGKTPKTSIQENYGGNIPFLTPSDDMFVKYVKETVKKITESGLKEVKSCLLPAGSICVSCIGSDLGKVVITTKPTVTNQQINSIIVDTEQFDTDFCYYLMVQLGKLLNYHSKTSTAVPIINKTNFSSYGVHIPDLETQQKIAKVLSAIDDKIELNNSINNNLEQQAQAIFKSWFIDVSDSNNSSEKFGKFPQLATELTVGDIEMLVTDYVANGSFASLKENVTLYQEPNYAYFVRNTDLKTNTFNVFVDEHSYKFLSKSTLYGDEIIISNVGDVGSVFLCPKLDLPMTLGNNIIMLRPKDNRLTYYLYIWFKWSYGQNLIQGIKGGSAQPKFNKTDFKSLPIIIPQGKLLDKFSDIMTPIFNSIEKNNEENKFLIQLRDTLLPKLMSGEIDVSNVEIDDILENQFADK